MKKLISSLIGLLIVVPAVQAAGAAVSGITDYAYDAAPKTVTRKMYNWEVTLSAADSKKGKYEIVQITHYLGASGKTPDTTNVLVDSVMLAPTSLGNVHFAFFAGDPAPRRDMLGAGHISEPVIYAALGTTKVVTEWITLAGTQIDQAIPSAKGTELVDGKLMLIEFDVTDKDGQKTQTRVLLRREPNAK